MSDDGQHPFLRFVVLPIVSGMISLYFVSKFLPENFEQNQPFWNIVLTGPPTEILLALCVLLSTPILSSLFLTRMGRLFLLLSIFIGMLLGYLLFLLIDGGVIPNLIFGIIGGVILSGYLAFLFISYKTLSEQSSEEELKELRETLFNPYTGTHLLVGMPGCSGCLSQLGLIMSTFAAMIYVGTVSYFHLKYSITISIASSGATFLIAFFIGGRVVGPVLPKEKIKCAQSSCSCMIWDDKQTCSTICESSGDFLQIRCDCGHAECTGHF